jgi:hypothetical protein
VIDTNVDVDKSDVFAFDFTTTMSTERVSTSTTVATKNVKKFVDKKSKENVGVDKRDDEAIQASEVDKVATF